MKCIKLFAVLLCIAFSSYGQDDWTGDASKLYYYNKGKKVYMETDYSSMAVYFKENPSGQVVRDFESAVARLSPSGRSVKASAKIMGNKKVMLLEGAEGLPSIRSAEERKAFFKYLWP